MLIALIVITDAAQTPPWQRGGLSPIIIVTFSVLYPHQKRVTRNSKAENEYHSKHGLIVSATVERLAASQPTSARVAEAELVFVVVTSGLTEMGILEREPDRAKGAVGKSAVRIQAFYYVRFNGTQEVGQQAALCHRREGFRRRAATQRRLSWRRATAK